MRNSLLLFLFSCAQVTSLNLKKHQFGRIPTKIIWIQVQGLNPEHLALLKFSLPSEDVKLEFEQFDCLGKAWEYSLFDIRPTPQASALAQLTGKKNLENSCNDYKLKPLWEYMLPKGYRVGIFEGEMPQEDSLLAGKSCEGTNAFFDGVTFWRMNKAPANAQYFHENDKNRYATNEVYYDKSCSTGECFNALGRNLKSVYDQFSKNNSSHLFLVRDTSFARAIASHNIKKAREILNQLNQSLAFFREKQESDSNTLVLVTSYAPQGVEFPRRGKEWESFDKAKTYQVHKKSKLIGTVFALGARSENFCGLYDQADLMSRIFSGAKQQGLELTIINPFE